SPCFFFLTLRWFTLFALLLFLGEDFAQRLLTVFHDNGINLGDIRRNFSSAHGFSFLDALSLRFITNAACDQDFSSRLSWQIPPHGEPVLICSACYLQGVSSQSYNISTYRISDILTY